MKYRICGGRLLFPDRIENKDLLLSDGIIEKVVERDVSVSSEYAVIDCQGLYVSPGFVDIHQHGGGGSDYMDANPEDYRNATEAHLAHGTTSVLPTLLSADLPSLLRAIDGYKTAKRDPSLRANLLGLHIEGPYISPKQAGAQKPEHIRKFNPKEYEEITRFAQGHIRRWSVAPELEGAERFAAFAKTEGITLSIAHSDADFDTTVKAFEWGYRHVTHLYSCVSTITRKQGFRVAGVLEAAYYLDEMNVEIIADGCHLPSCLLATVAKFKKNGTVALITDAMRAAGQDTKKSFLGSREDPLPVIVEDGVAKLIDRSAFAGSVATADRLIQNMLSCGTSLTDAVKMVTLNPLKMMNLPVRKGELKEGYDADLCIFDEEIRIQKVICGGRLV